MRGYVLAISCLLLLSESPGTAVPGLFAQDAKPTELDAVLQKWEKAMKGLQSYVAVVDRNTIDKALDVKEEHRGLVMLSKTDAKVGIQARFECTSLKDPSRFEKYIYAGADLYEYAPTNNTVRHHTLAKNAKGVIEQDTFVSLVLGMTVKHVRERFDLKQDKDAPKDRFYYGFVEPKNAKDRAEFSLARVVFDRENHLIAQIWFRQANGKEITWNFSQMQINVQIPARYFEAETPTGWKRDDVKTPLVLPKLAP